VTRTGFQLAKAGGKAIEARVAKRIAPSAPQCDHTDCASVAPIMTHPDTTYRSLSIRGLGPWFRFACAGWFRDRRDGCGSALERANHQFVRRRGWAWRADRVRVIAHDQAGERQQRGVDMHRPSGRYEWSFRPR
jgi:hypothetical protein